MEGLWRTETWVHTVNEQWCVTNIFAPLVCAVAVGAPWQVISHVLKPHFFPKPLSRVRRGEDNCFGKTRGLSEKLPNHGPTKPSIRAKIHGVRERHRNCDVL